MLHALAHKKTRFHLRYSGHRAIGEVRVGEEDEITSMVFGPLEFIDSKSVFEFWQEVFRSQNLSLTPDQSGSPDEMTMFSLWPRRNKVEPDGHLSFSWMNGKRVDLLLELKWRAPLSGNDQLQKQWNEYLTTEAKQYTWHVFIAPNISEGLKAKTANLENIWTIKEIDRLVLVSWSQIRDTLIKYQNRKESIGKWARLSSNFLASIGVSRFRGFDDSRVSLPIKPIQNSIFFAKDSHKHPDINKT